MGFANRRYDPRVSVVLQQIQVLEPIIQILDPLIQYGQQIQILEPIIQFGLDGYVTESELNGLNITVSEHYKQLSQVLLNILDSLDGYGGGAVAELKTMLIDENGVYTYVGEAAPGTATSESGWRIYRLDESGDGSIELVKQWANRSTDFDQVWDDREDPGTIYS